MLSAALRVVVLVCIAAGGASLVEAQTPERIPAGAASVIGRAVDAASKRPLEHVIVTLTSLKSRASLTSTTDADGRYAFEGIEPGEYRLSALLDGYGLLDYGGPSFPIRIPVPDAQATRIDFALQPAGGISGRIINTEGQPLANVNVTTLPTQDGRRMTITPANSARTDERGVYTIRNVPEGSYRVLAQWADPAMLKAGARGDLRVVHFPGAERPEDALTIRVRAGETLSNINITIPSKHYVRFSGHVLRGNSDGLIEALVLLGAWSIRTVPIAEDGAFEVTHLTPGRYTFWARATTPDGFEAAVATLDLESDLTDLTWPLLPTGGLKGRLVRDDGGVLPADGLQIAAVQADQGKAIDPLERDRADVDSEGRFHLVGLFGERVLRVMGLGPQWHVDRIMQGKTLVESLTIAPGQETTDLTVVVKRRP